MSPRSAGRISYCRAPASPANSVKASAGGSSRTDTGVSSMSATRIALGLRSSILTEQGRASRSDAVQTRRASNCRGAGNRRRSYSHAAKRDEVPHEKSGDQTGRPPCRHQPHQSHQQEHKKTRGEAEGQSAVGFGRRFDRGRYQRAGHLPVVSEAVAAGSMTRGTATLSSTCRITWSAVRPSMSASGFSSTRWRKTGRAAALISSGRR